MKTSLIQLAAILLCLSFSSCNTTDTEDEDDNEAPDREQAQIHVGMSKSQVMRAWGKPSGTDVTARGEIWVYGNENMKRMIPYAGPFLNVRTSKVMFDNSGHVVDFRNTNSGNVWSQSEGMGGSRFSSW